RVVAYKNNGTSTSFDGTTTSVMTSTTTFQATSGPFFFAAAPYFDGSTYGAPNIGDFNNDGYVDFISKVDSLGTVYLGSSSGQFRHLPYSGVNTGEYSPTTYFTRQTHLADFNADGNLDYIVGNWNGGNFGNVSINLGVGDGTFIHQNLMSTDYGSNCSAGVRSLASADFNKDSRLDLAVGHGCNGWWRVSIFYGMGDGTFYPSPGTVTLNNNNAGAGIDQLVATDYNFDGNADLVLGSNSGYLILVRGNGDATFQTPTASPLTSAAAMSNLEVGDINQDGLFDYVFSADNASTWGYQLGGGLPVQNTFTGPSLYNFYNFNSVRLADWDDDGRLDVLALKRGIGGIHFYKNTGGASIFTTPAVLYGLQNHGQNMYLSQTIGDLNGDGLPDLISGGLDANVGNSLGVNYNLSQ
ncbi:VCBS repeat-containing protein, partial [bacterium]|nr:VCBS repeat-containing protein [bacterium]